MTEDNSAQRLEACPFCGGTAFYDMHTSDVICNSCACQGPAYGPEAEAIAAWNTRSPTSAAMGGEAMRAAIVESLKGWHASTNREGRSPLTASVWASAVGVAETTPHPAKPAQSEEVERLREALQPFSVLCDRVEETGSYMPGAGFTLMHHKIMAGTVSLVHLRKARAALTPSAVDGGE